MSIWNINGQAVTVFEAQESRDASVDADSSSIDVVYIVTGTDSEGSVFAAVNFEAPAAWQLSSGVTLVKAGISSTRVTDYWYKATVRYGIAAKIERQEDSPPIFSFEIGTTTAHITQSLETVKRYNKFGNSDEVIVEDFEGAIGVTNDGIDGCDILVPTLDFSETRYIPRYKITGAWKKNLARMAGKWNNAPFKGFQPNEVQFLGASGSQRGAEDLEISFKFKAEENIENLTVGKITGISKKGNEYLWVRYNEELDPKSKTIVRRPRSAHVERVHLTTNFALIGIGT